MLRKKLLIFIGSDRFVLEKYFYPRGNNTFIHIFILGKYTFIHIFIYGDDVDDDCEKGC